MSGRDAETAGAEETRAFARDLAADLRPGDVLLLIGDFGAGKTTFVQGLAEGLGVRDLRAVCSPTFVLMNVYAGRVPLHHLDATRFGDPREVFSLGWEDAGRGVTAIEWGDRVRDHLPATCWRIVLDHVSEERRRIRVTAPGESRG